ncbi:MAG: Rrf2 family transcriptional regulator [Deltaproteobacteria bacterium]|nr:Rrf2 family transcriptional regulator [Deltaproteobacteria bacterium]
MSVRVSLAVHILLVTQFYSDTLRVTGKLLTGSTGCNPVIVRTIVLALKKAGMLTVKRGSSGGSELARDPWDISLWDIVEAVDPEAIKDIASGVHVGSSQVCPVGRHIQDVLREPYRRIAGVIEGEMRTISLADLSKVIPIEEIHRSKEEAEPPGKDDGKETGDSAPA